MINNGGITVNNALLTKMDRYNTVSILIQMEIMLELINTYSYSLSNIFQLEFINTDSFKNVNQNNYFSSSINNTYLNINNFHIRLGGKFLLFATQKMIKFGQL